MMNKDPFAIAPKVMIELLVKCYGVHWAGWYSPENLERVYNEKSVPFSKRHPSYGGGFSIVNEPGYLPGDRRRPSKRVLEDRARCAKLRAEGKA